MKSFIEQKLYNALCILDIEIKPEDVRVYRNIDRNRGDFSTNIAFLIAKNTKDNVYSIANKLVAVINNCQYIQQIVVVEKGFINFYVNLSGYIFSLKTILDRKHDKISKNMNNIVKYAHERTNSLLYQLHLFDVNLFNELIFDNIHDMSLVKCDLDLLKILDRSLEQSTMTAIQKNDFATSVLNYYNMITLFDCPILLNFRVYLLKSVLYVLQES